MPQIHYSFGEYDISYSYEERRNYHEYDKILKKIKFYADFNITLLAQFNDTQYAFEYDTSFFFLNEFVHLTVRVRIYHNNTTII